MEEQSDASRELEGDERIVILSERSCERSSRGDFQYQTHDAKPNALKSLTTSRLVSRICWERERETKLEPEIV